MSPEYMFMSIFLSVKRIRAYSWNSKNICLLCVSQKEFEGIADYFQNRSEERRVGKECLL